MTITILCIIHIDSKYNAYKLFNFFWQECWLTPKLLEFRSIIMGFNIPVAFFCGLSVPRAPIGWHISLVFLYYYSSALKLVPVLHQITSQVYLFAVYGN